MKGLHSRLHNYSVNPSHKLKTQLPATRKEKAKKHTYKMPSGKADNICEVSKHKTTGSK